MVFLQEDARINVNGVLFLRKKDKFILIWM